MVSLLGQRENHKYRQIQADLRFSFYYTHIAISQGKIILHLYKKAIKRVIYLERFLSKRLRFLKIFGSLQRISFNYLKTHWYGTPHCLLKLDKWIYDKGYETCSNTFRTNARWQTLLVWSISLNFIEQITAPKFVKLINTDLGWICIICACRFTGHYLW